MRKDELNRTLDLLKPSESQKKAMLVKIRQEAAPVKRRVNPFYIAAPVAAALVLCVSLALFGLRGGNSVQIPPSDPVAELPEVSSKQMNTSHESAVDSSEEASSKSDASSKTGSKASDVQMQSSVNAPASNMPTTSEPGTSTPETPENPYDFSDITVDYEDVQITWDYWYYGVPNPSDPPASTKPPTTATTSSDADGVGVDTESPAGSYCPPEPDENDSVLILGNRCYTADWSDHYLYIVSSRYTDDDIGEQIAIGPNGEAIHRYGGIYDDLLIMEDVENDWTVFYFDGFVGECTGRDVLAVYGTTSPETINSIYITYVDANLQRFEYDITEPVQIEAFYDGFYHASSCEKSKPTGVTDVVVYLKNGHAMRMRYRPAAEGLYLGNLVFDTADTTIGAALRAMLNSNG